MNSGQSHQLGRIGPPVNAGGSTGRRTQSNPHLTEEIRPPTTGCDGSDQRRTPVTPAVERHYTVAEVASMWALSEDAVRGIFEKEPGVLVVGDAVGRRGKRRYRTLRIPESVLQRVHRRLSIAA